MIINLNKDNNLRILQEAQRQINHPFKVSIFTVVEVMQTVGEEKKYSIHPIKIDYKPINDLESQLIPALLDSEEDINT